MEVLAEDPVTVPCHACGAMAEHHPFVKPMSITMGLICARCGAVRTAVGKRKGALNLAFPCGNEPEK